MNCAPKRSTETEQSLSTLLARTDDRHLRAQAWAHVHRVNPQTARKMLRRVRSRQRSI